LRIAKNKAAAIAIAIILTISLAASVLLQGTKGAFPPAGTEIPSYSYINVGPNPIGVGQTVTVNMFHAIPTFTSESYEGMMVYVTDPDGHTTTLGPFSSDTTGGTATTYTPDQVGIWDFQMKYPGQTLSTGVIQQPGESAIVHLVVQEEQVTRSSYPINPLPSQYWETPVSAMNVDNWYGIMGPWYGITGITFISTGGNFYGGNYNPYTDSVKAGHVLWTKPWGQGGVAGGVQGPGKEDGHFWTTRQYWPQYGPVIMNGRMYSDYYTITRAAAGFNGIVCTDLYTGETLWTIETESENLRCGMQMGYHNLNMYGTVGPFILTTGTHEDVYSRGTAYHVYDGVTGKYMMSIVNGSNMVFEVGDRGHLIGYWLDTQDGQRMINAVNMTLAMVGGDGFSFNIQQDREFELTRGLLWSKPFITEVNGVTIDPALAINEVTEGAIVCTGGFTFGQGFGGTQNGWLVVGAVDTETGDQLWVKNITYADTDTLEPYTRTEMGIIDGLWLNANMENMNVVAFNARTGAKEWTAEMRGDNGARPNFYDIFNLRWSPGPGVSFFRGFGGDIWCLENTDGTVRWYTNTTKLVGSPGTENPYGIWPLWVFECDGITNDVAYFPIGHEYNPPMFPGAQTLAVNITDGSLVWSELGMYIRSTAIAYGIMLTLNGYDNQIYAYGKGPTSTTVVAPNTGLTTETPITITGTVMDVSEGTNQHEVAANFPNGLPCVSDESQSHWMEYVYQDQPKPTDVTGVPVILSVTDSNDNTYEIGTTMTDDSGTFGFTWTPIISGDYTIVASFVGSNSYWGSSAETHFYAGEMPQATPEPTPQPASVADLYFVPSVIGIIVVIIVVGAVLILMLRRK
jgi:hypothetical protein